MGSTNKEMKKYYKTKTGLVNRIIGSQRSRSRKKGMIPPSYTTQELREWLMSQALYHKLYNLWVLSGYDKALIPSIDRIDDYSPYCFSNIQLMTWSENNAKHWKDRREGKNNKINKAVVAFSEKNKIIFEFHSAMQAERETGISNSTIIKCCKNKNKTAGGYSWKYKY